MAVNLLSEKLIGVWLLESFTDTLADGSVRHTLGSNAAGYISYQPEGWVSVQIMAADRTPYDNPDITGGTRQQLASAASRYFAYAGTYITDEQRQTVTHTLHYCLIPNWVGSRQLRHVNLLEDNKLLILASDPMVFDGVVHQPELRWRRRTS